MAKILIVVDGSEESVIGHMARVVAGGVRDAGLEVITETIANARASDLEKYDGVIIGSPCCFAGPSAAVKTFMDSSYSLMGKLVGKVGGAFTSSKHISGGNELTLRSIQDFFLIHGMIIQGDHEGDHFGPVAINPSGDQEDVVVDDAGECSRLGKRVAELTKRLS